MADFDEASDEAKIGAFDYVRADNLWSKKYGIDNGSFDHLGNNIKWTFEEAASWIRVLTENKQSLVTKLRIGYNSRQSNNTEKQNYQKIPNLKTPSWYELNNYI